VRDAAAAWSLVRRTLSLTGYEAVPPLRRTGVAEIDRTALCRRRQAAGAQLQQPQESITTRTVKVSASEQPRASIAAASMGAARYTSWRIREGRSILYTRVEEMLRRLERRGANMRVEGRSRARASRSTATKRTVPCALTLGVGLLVIVDSNTSVRAEVWPMSRAETLVVNAEHPVHPGRGRLVDEVVIRGDGDRPEYQFTRIAEIAVAPNGTIYVIDGEEKREIRAFGADGKFLRRVGRRGQGPGEYLSPTGIKVLPDGRPIIRDVMNVRLQVFASDGGGVKCGDPRSRADSSAPNGCSSTQPASST
jgi:hypothetical protein